MQKQQFHNLLILCAAVGKNTYFKSELIAKNLAKLQRLADSLAKLSLCAPVNDKQTRMIAKRKSDFEKRACELGKEIGLTIEPFQVCFTFALAGRIYEIF